jgi:SnoaL-like domain
VDGIRERDAALLEACFAPDVSFRALIPPGLRERVGARETAELILRWFAGSTELDLEDASVEAIGDRLHIRYRFAGVEDGEPYVVEQQLYCVLVDGLIASADLLCSGFRPRL